MRLSKVKLKAVLSLLVATSIYGFYSVVFRNIAVNYGVFSQNWIKNLLIFLIVFLLVDIKSLSKKINKRNILWILFWGMSGCVSTITGFIAFNKLPIGLSLFTFYAGSIITIFIFTRFFFKSKLTKIKIFSSTLSIIGLLIIFGFDMNISNAEYLFVAFISGVTLGIWYIGSRKISDQFNEFELVWCDALINVVLCIIIAFLIGDKFNSNILNTSSLFIIVATFCSITATFCIIYGFKYLSAQTASMITLMDIVFGTLLALIFYKEIPTIPVLIGGIFIMIAWILSIQSEVEHAQMKKLQK